MLPLPAEFAIPFDLKYVDKSYPPGFPQELNFHSTDSLTGEPFAKFFKKAQDAHLPGYSIAIADYGVNKKGVPKFDVFDTLHLTRYKPEDPENDPIKKHKIIKIYYFFLECYNIHEETICSPVHLEDKNLTFIPLRANNPELLSLTINSLNFRLFDSDANLDPDAVLKSQQEVRRHEFIISHKLDEMMPSLLTSEDKLNKMKIWLCCAAYDSLIYRPTIKLRKLFESNQVILDLLLSRFQEPRLTPIRQEIPAYYTLKQIKDEQST